MDILKNVVLILLSFILFLSLCIFGLAFMLDRTVLNPRFSTSEIDRLDFPLLVEEVLDEQASEQELSSELIDVITDSIEKTEPLLKQQMIAAINSVYDYLLGKKQEPELALTLRNTVFNTDFINSVVDELDMSYIVDEYVFKELAEEIPEEIEYLVEYFDVYLDLVVIQNRPWLKEQITQAAGPIIDYYLGVSQSLYVVISVEPVMESIKDTLREPFLQSPPAKLTGLSRSKLLQHYENYFEDLYEAVSLDIEIDEKLLETETRADIIKAIADVEEVLERIQRYVGTFRLVYILLIVFILLLIAGIILISRDVKYITLILGITFLVYGIIEFVGIFITRHFIKTLLPLSEMSPSLQTWTLQFFNNFLAPLQWFSLGILIVGIALFVVSFVYKRGQYSS